MYGSKHIRSNPPSTTSGLSIDISAKTNELGVLYHHCTSKRIRHIKVDQRRLRPHRAATFEILWIQEFKKKGGRKKADVNKASCYGEKQAYNILLTAPGTPMLLMGQEVCIVHMMFAYDVCQYDEVILFLRQTSPRLFSYYYYYYYYYYYCCCCCCCCCSSSSSFYFSSPPSS